MASNNKFGANQWGDPRDRIDRCEKLLSKPMTRDELIRESGYSEQVIRRYLRVLHQGTPKRVYVCGYREGRTTWSKVYIAGSFPDVPRPLNKKDVAAERIKAKRDGLAINKTREKVHVDVHRDPLHAALFGSHRRAA